MSWILTYTGKHFDVLNPDRSMVDIIDIAVALSRMPRFVGHTEQPYSVAQHSVLCSLTVLPAFALQALLHDATEAYIADVPSPVKQLCPDYKRIEARIWRAIAEAFGLPMELDESVKDADLAMLATEKRDLLVKDSRSWPILNGVMPYNATITPWTESVAYSRFYCRFHELRGGKF